MFLTRPTPPRALRPLALVLLTNLLFSANPLASVSWSLHFLLYFLFVSTLSFPLLSRALSRALPLALLTQLALATAQVWLGHALQGPLYYLGERLVSVGQPGIALATVAARVVLRAYGTFGHPNAYAGYAVLAALLLLLLPSSRPTVTKFSVFIATTLTLALTQSRAAALAFFGLITPLSLLATLRSRLFFVTLLSTFLLATPSVFTRSLDLSFSERLSLQHLSLRVISSSPLLGAGTNAALSLYPALAPNFRLLQPDHNSFTLALSWFGLFGLLALVLTLVTSVPAFSHPPSHLILRGVLFVLPLLLLDHYLLTSPQGLFILLLYGRALSALPASRQ